MPIRILTDLRPGKGQKVNLYLDEKFFCSLELAQVVDLKLHVGDKIDPKKADSIKQAASFSRLYLMTLNFVLLRPRSEKELRDYLNLKTKTRTLRKRNARTGVWQSFQKAGFKVETTNLVFERIKARGYIDDTRFAKIWLENRAAKKGISKKKLILELRQKGIHEETIQAALEASGRDDKTELRKLIQKKAKRYQNDASKLKQYLFRQGFNYDDINAVLSEE